MSAKFTDNDKITVAVITGGHGFDVPGFHAIFRAMPEVDSYIQHQDDFVEDVAKVRDEYDVLLFYNMPRGEPDTNAQEVFEQLGQSGQGIILLHHAILAYLPWSFWGELVGIPDRSFGFSMMQELAVEVADPGHPITSGVASWQMLDETYSMASAGEDSRVLLTTDHPDSMHVLGWTRQFRNSRVFCLQSGHDNLTYVDPNFRTMLSRGIQWCAGRI